MRLQWKPSLEKHGATYHDATDEATGIAAVVECEDLANPKPWVWYLANYPVVSRKPVSEEAIQLCAYQKWQTAGKPGGDGVNFWLEAEREVSKAK